jgi:hypothetical protein
MVRLGKKKVNDNRNASNGGKKGQQQQKSL